MVREASRLPKNEQLIDTGYERKESALTVQAPSFESLVETDEATKPQPELTHIDSSGEARMVDVGDKAITERVATARCEVAMSAKTLSLIRSGSVGKGDVIATAKLAGVMGGKRTAELIPMCHNIPISQIEVDIEELADGTGLRIEATTRARWRTGVEMEAMTAASIAALTVYDMCKSADRGIRVTNLRLLRKSGGKSGDYVAE
ncbi:MAG: cyclic pyranopterin monophosphate synthase MoaC [Chloroflexi bacterium]|nr:cyclic pyranopterin monophosphate synthase MoaC [Chloroflexota bacterium]MYK62036.1 cyclic pyranopterin monophosphate synthase MoaC [Chloroflexota bacterium]